MTAAPASARTPGWVQRLREAWPWGPAPADEVGALPVRDRFDAGSPGAGTLAGHDRTLLQAADFLWSLSPLTLQHELALVVALEQLYRAHTILAGHPYHRD